MKDKNNSNINRLKEIISILKKHHLVTNMNPTNLREALEEAGPTFIKIGQIMADREDLLKDDYCNELRKLRSKVKPMDEETVTKIIKEELKEKRFDLEDIESIPIGSASIAEVHKAKLKGKDVVLKIERENIAFQMENDIKLLKKALKFIPIEKIFHNLVDFNSLLDELLESAKKEMDFLNEIAYMERFRQNNLNVPFIKVPKVYKEYSTSNLIVMEYIDGPKINDINTLTNLGYDLKQISSLLSKNYIKQVIEDGFYHADPHPDNLKIQNNQIVYLDFGMMGTLNDKLKHILKNCIEALVLNDTEKLVNNIIILGNTKNINKKNLTKDLEIILDKNLNTEIKDIDLKDFAPDIFNILQIYKIEIPKDITMLIRGIIVLEGVLEDIDKELSLMDVLKTQIKPSDLLSTKNFEKGALKILQNSKSLASIPAEILKLSKSLNQEEIIFKIEKTSSQKEELKKDKIIAILILAILDFGFMISLAITSLSEIKKANIFTNLFTTCFIIDTIFLLFITFFNFMKKK